MFDSNDNSKQKIYTSLANKYRPQTFEEVVGQESVSKTLMNAVKSGRIAHAYLFYGPRGCGKTTTARILAKALNCTGNGNDKPTAEPCGKCPQCTEIADSSDMDVLELDAASNTQVERVREAIIDTVALAAGRDRYKVFILDEVHMLSSSSFNALLKTIEEPPAHVVFILATTELHKVPLTIASRCQTFRFRPITEEQISSHLLELAEAESIDLEESAAKIIAKSAGGALRDALTIFDRAISFSNGKVDKELVSEMLGILPQDLIQNALKAVINKDGKALHQVFETVQSEGFDSLSLIKDLKDTLGEVFYFSMGAGKEPFKGAKDCLEGISPAFLAGLTRKISKLIDEVKYSDTPALLAEAGLFSIMENSIDIENFVSRLEALEKSASSDEDDSGSKPAPKTMSARIYKKPVKTHEETSSFSAEAVQKPAVKTEAVSTPVAVAEQEPAVEPVSSAKFSSADCPQMWEQFKKGLTASFPFLYEMVRDLPVSFENPAKWTLKVKQNDDFLKTTLQRRINDLQGLALKLFSAPLKFEIVFDSSKTAAAPAPIKPTVFYQKPKAAPKAVKEPISVAKSAPVAAAAEKKADGPISKEQPFLAGDYSADLKPAAEQKPVSGAAKEILDIFQGQVVESV